MLIESENIWQTYLGQAARVDPQPCDLADNLLVHLLYTLSLNLSLSLFLKIPKLFIHFPLPFLLPPAALSAYRMDSDSEAALSTMLGWDCGIRPTVSLLVLYSFSLRAGAEIMRVHNSSNMVV